jgi:hypothetical protein
MPSPGPRFRAFEVNHVIRCTVGDQLTDIVLGFNGVAVVRLIVRPGRDSALAGLFALAGHAAGKAVLDIPGR